MKEEEKKKQKTKNQKLVNNSVELAAAQKTDPVIQHDVKNLIPVSSSGRGKDGLFEWLESHSARHLSWNGDSSPTSMDLSRTLDKTAA